MAFCWWFFYAIVSSVAYPYAREFTVYFSFAFAIASFFVSILMRIAEVRGTLYNHMSAGLQLKSIGHMVKHHPLGLIKLILIQLVFFAMYYFLFCVHIFVFSMFLGPVILYLPLTILGTISGWIPSVIGTMVLEFFAVILVPTVSAAFLIFLSCMHDTQYDDV